MTLPRGGRAVLSGLLVAVLWFLFLRDVRPVDLSVFLDAGRSVLAHRNPYPSLHSSLLHSNAAFVYPEVVAWAFAPLAALPPHLVGPLFTATGIAALLAGGALLTGRRAGAGLAVVASTSALIGLEDGTVNALLFLALALAWRFRMRGVLCGLLLAAVVVTKLFLWPVLLWPLVARRRTTFGVAVSMTALPLALGWMFGSLGVGGYSRLLGTLSRIEAPHGKSLAALLSLAGLPGPLTTVACLLTALAVLALAAHRSRRGLLAEPDLFAVTVGVAVLTCPIVWVHYQVLLFAAVAAGATTARRCWLLTAVTWLQAVPHAGLGSGSGHGPAWWGALVGTVIPATIIVLSLRRRPFDLPAEHQNSVRVSGRPALGHAAS